ncbi:MAG: ATP synthase F1 subunit delta [Armatimonadota bacterium]
MLARRIASRYTQALFDLAQQQGKTEEWERELATLATVLTSTPELPSVLAHPEIPLSKKEAVLTRAFQGKIAPEVLRVLFLLIKRGHEPDIDTLHQIYVERWNAVRRIVPVKVTTAVPISDEQSRTLIQVLTRRLGATVQLSRDIDPNLIAGMVVTIGDRVIDASARTTLEQLRASMMGL